MCYDNVTMLEIKTSDNKTLIIISDKDFSEEKPLILNYISKGHKDTKWVRLTKKIKLLLN